MQKNSPASVSWDKYLLVVFVLAAIGLCFYGCSGKKATESVSKKASSVDKKDVIASVGDEVITKQEFEDEIQSLPQAYQAIAKQNRKEFLNSLVNKKLLIAEAKKENLENSPEVKKYMEKAKDELMVQQLLKDKVLDKVKITDEAVKAYYDSNADQFKDPEKFKASHILLKSEAEANAVLAELKAGADFGKVAKEKSEDPGSRDKEGDIGYFSKGDLVPEFEDAVSKMKVGDVSAVVKTALGYHIIKLTDKKESAKKDFKDVEQDIKNRLTVENQMKAYDGLIESLKKGQKIDINQAFLDEKKEEPVNMNMPIAPGVSGPQGDIQVTPVKPPAVAPVAPSNVPNQPVSGK